jgi:hypothetical protein
MNVIVNSTGLTEESFRNSEKLRTELNGFVEGGCGASLLFLLKQRAKVKSKRDAVPPDAIPTYSVAELSRLAGIQEAIDLIEGLCETPSQQNGRVTIPQLGVHDEKSLPPKFEVKATPVEPKK